MTSHTQSIPFAQVATNGGTQSRAALNEETVAEYAEAIAAGATFPPVIVYHDGTEYWLADGFHRLAAASAAGKAEVDADVRQGDRRDAILHSVGANASHGLRRTNADKHRAVQALLEDEEWAQWPDTEIARRCAVGRAFVAKLRADVTCTPSASEPVLRKYINKHGQESVMNVSRIGRSAVPSPSAQDEASEQAVAPKPKREPSFATEDDVAAGILKGEAVQNIDPEAPAFDDGLGEYHDRVSEFDPASLPQRLAEALSEIDRLAEMLVDRDAHIGRLSDDLASVEASGNQGKALGDALRRADQMRGDKERYMEVAKKRGFILRRLGYDGLGRPLKTGSPADA